MDKYRIANNSASNSTEKPAVRLGNHVNVSEDTGSKSGLSLDITQKTVSLDYSSKDARFQVSIETNFILDLWSRFLNGNSSTFR